MAQRLVVIAAWYYMNMKQENQPFPEFVWIFVVTAEHIF